MQQRKTNQFCTGLKQRLVSSLTLERFRDCRPHNRNRSRLFGEWLKNGVNNGKFTPNNRDVRCPPCLGYTPCLGCGADFLNTKKTSPPRLRERTRRGGSVQGSCGANQPSTLLVRGSPCSSSLILPRVVRAMLWSASSVKKAWCEVSTTLGTMSRRASTSSSIILSLRSS